MNRPDISKLTAHVSSFSRWESRPGATHALQWLGRACSRHASDRLPPAGHASRASYVGAAIRTCTGTHARTEEVSSSLGVLMSGMACRCQRLVAH